MLVESQERYDSLYETLGESVCSWLGVVAVPEGFELSVVIPVYNEVDTIVDVIRRVQEVSIPTEIIVVDDASSDGTGDLLEERQDELGIKLYRHEENRGKGAGLRTGFQHATGDAVIVQDADFEYDPRDYPKLLEPLLDGRADVVFGSRFAGRAHRVLYFWHSIGNQILTLASNAFTNLNLTDMETGYKLFKREVIQKIAPTLRESRFGIEPEMTAKVAALPGIRIYEVPISYSGRTYAEGKKIGWRDGVSAFRCIVKYGLMRPKKLLRVVE